MQEEPAAAIGVPAAELGCHVHQVIVVNPDEVPGLRHVVHCARVLAIHLAVGTPIDGVEVAEHLHVVKQRPDDLVREALVEIAHLVRAEGYAFQRVAGVRADRGEFAGEVARISDGTGPAYPDAASVAQNGKQRGHEPPRARLGVPVPGIGAPEYERQAVRYHDEAVSSAGIARE